jgi:hypothetical protein
MSHKHVSSVARRSGLLGLATAVLLLASAPAATADDATCTYYGGTTPYLGVSVKPNPSNYAAYLWRSGSELRLYNGSGYSDCGAATVTNTAYITIKDASYLTAGSVDPFYIDLTGGAYAPGFGDEPGSSDEIEFNVKLGGGQDGFGILATGPTPQVIRLGTKTGTPLINLNASETDGIDPDVALHGVDEAFVYASYAADRVRGDGGAGSGSKGFDRRLHTVGFDGNDRLVGGTAGDSITGDSALSSTVPGADFINGLAGRDVLWGGGNNDSMYGGPGDDALYGGPGNDSLDGGGGVDRCYGEAGSDTFTGCEHVQP